MSNRRLNEAATDQNYTKKELAYQDMEREKLRTAQYAASLLSDGAILTPAGEKFIAWLDQAAPRFQATAAPVGRSNIEQVDDATAIKSYVGNVLNSQTFTAAKWITVYFNLAAILWAMYQKQLQTDATPSPAQESAKPSPAVARMLQLQERAAHASNLRTTTARFVDFMRQAAGVIANAPKSTTEARQAANHWREHVGRAGVPAVIYMRDNPQRTAVLYAIFEAYERDGGHTPPARPLPKLATTGGILTPIGKNVTQILQAQAKAGTLKRTPAINAFLAMTEGAGVPPGDFYAQNPRQAEHLYTYTLTHLQAEMQAIRGEIDAVKAEVKESKTDDIDALYEAIAGAKQAREGLMKTVKAIKHE